MFYLKYLPGDSKLDNLTPTLKKLLETADKKVNAKQLIRILDLIDELNHNLSNSTSQHLKLELFLMKVIKPELGSDIKTVSYRVDLLEGDVYWPKILEEMKSELSPRKFSYLTAVRAEVEEDTINLIVDKENEFLFEQLKKSQEITELLQSIVAKLMGLEVSVKVSLNPNARLDDGKKGLSVAQEIFDVEDLN